MRERGWFVVAIVFLILWVLSEISDRTEMADFRAEVHDFHSQGDRFTADDGRLLLERVERLERECLDE